MKSKASLPPKQMTRSGSRPSLECNHGGNQPHVPRPSRPPPPLQSLADAEDTSQDEAMQQANLLVELRALQRADVRLSGGPPAHAHPPPELVDMVPHLMDGAFFKVHRVWYNLQTHGSQGYFGIYWFCHTQTHKFILHATLAKWKMQPWLDAAVTFDGRGRDINALKREFDDWLRLPGKYNKRPHAAQFLAWHRLDHIGESNSIQCKDGFRWRALLHLRQCEEQRFLYDRKMDFERIYDVRENQKSSIHYSLESVRMLDRPCELHLEGMD